MIYLNFNESVSMSSNWNSSAWALQMFGPLGENNYQFSWNVTNQAQYMSILSSGTSQMVINFQCDNQLYGGGLEYVVVSFNERGYLYSYTGKSVMINESVIVYPYG